jgi:hypothetical protein
VCRFDVVLEDKELFDSTNATKDNFPRLLELTKRVYRSNMQAEWQRLQDIRGAAPAEELPESTAPNDSSGAVAKVRGQQKPTARKRLHYEADPEWGDDDSDAPSTTRRHPSPKSTAAPSARTKKRTNKSARQSSGMSKRASLTQATLPQAAPPAARQAPQRRTTAANASAAATAAATALQAIGLDEQAALRHAAASPAPASVQKQALARPAAADAPAAGLLTPVPPPTPPPASKALGSYSLGMRCKWDEAVGALESVYTLPVDSPEVEALSSIFFALLADLDTTVAKGGGNSVYLSPRTAPL